MQNRRMNWSRLFRFVLQVMGLLSIQILTYAQNTQNAQAIAEPDASTEGLQKATQNPVASLISVPIQNNSNFDIGPFDRTQNVLNVQPVIPVKLNEKISL